MTGRCTVTTCDPPSPNRPNSTGRVLIPANNTHETFPVLLRRAAALAGVTFEAADPARVAQIRKEIADGNMDAVPLEKAPRIADAKAMPAAATAAR